MFTAAYLTGAFRSEATGGPEPASMARLAAELRRRRVG